MMEGSPISAAMDGGGYYKSREEDEGVNDERGDMSDSEVPLKLFVGQVPKDMDEEQLTPIFEVVGEIAHIMVIRDKQTKMHRGCMFLTYRSRQAGERAIAMFNNTVKLRNAPNPIQMRPADAQSANRENKLFVGMLPLDTDEEELMGLFGVYGEIVEIYIMKNYDGSPKGCAFVKFTERQSAVAALKGLHDKQIDRSPRPLVVKFADIKQKQFPARTWQDPQIRMSTNGSDSHLSDRMPSHGAVSSGHGSHSTQGQSQSSSSMQPQPYWSGGAAGQYYTTTASGYKSAIPIPPNAQMYSYGGYPYGMVVQQAQPQGQHHTSLSHIQQGHSTHAGMQYNPSAQAQGQQVLVYGAPQAVVPTSSTTHTGAGSGGGSQHQQIQHGGASQQSQQATPAYLYYSAAPPGLYGEAPSGGTSGGGGTGYSEASDPPSAVANLLGGGRSIEGPKGANLFVYHLPHDLTDADLATAFAPFGNVISAKVFIDKRSGESKGFGFVSYDTPSSADEAIKSMNGFQIGTKRLKVAHKRVHSDGMSPTQLSPLVIGTQQQQGGGGSNDQMQGDMTQQMSQSMAVLSLQGNTQQQSGQQSPSQQQHRQSSPPPPPPPPLH